MRAIGDMKREGLSIQFICALTGHERKTVRKYLVYPESAPTYPKRPEAPSKLDAHRACLKDRLKAGVWNAQVLLRDIQDRACRSRVSGRLANHRRYPLFRASGSYARGAGSVHRELSNTAECLFVHLSCMKHAPR